MKGLVLEVDGQQGGELRHPQAKLLIEAMEGV